MFFSVLFDPFPSNVWHFKLCIYFYDILISSTGTVKYLENKKSVAKTP